jgi:transposase
MVTFKTDCPCCGGKKKIKTKATFIGKSWHVEATKCHKCGHQRDAFST